MIKLSRIFFIACLLSACAPSVQVQTLPTVSAPPAPRVTQPKARVTPIPGPTRAPTWTPEPSSTPAGLLFTPDPFNQYSIQALRIRQYGGGAVQNLGVLLEERDFTRFSIQYPSDQLNIAGFVNVPLGTGVYPVIIVLHGYIFPAEYETLDYTTGVADDLASQGYIVVHPNLRNFPPSDIGNTFFRVGYAVDVLNLIAHIRESAGKPGMFEYADAGRIGLWGHSMGGGIALKVAVVSPQIRAVLLYAATSGDEHKNSELFLEMTGSNENEQELQVGQEVFKTVSPDRFYRNINAIIQIHHGSADSVIPVSWAQDTCEKLRKAERQVECFFYAGAEHTFRSKYQADYAPRVLVFFENTLKK